MPGSLWILLSLIGADVSPTGLLRQDCIMQVDQTVAECIFLKRLLPEQRRKNFFNCFGKEVCSRHKDTSPSNNHEQTI